MILNVENLHVKYGNVEALHGIDIHVQEGEIVTILGANGAGKSTTLMAISGLVKASQGKIEFEGEAVHKLPAHTIVTRGIAQVPEGRRVFSTLTVQENLNWAPIRPTIPTATVKT
jgi:branched-chain amino acid transport system ATP-binding protein